MAINRRTLLQWAAGTALASARPTRSAWAETYPARPVRILAGYPPGGVVDTYARLIGVALSDRLGQQFVVENRPGAGGTIAATEAARAAPDGYTLLLTTSADAWNASLYDRLSFDVLRDFVQIAPVSRGPGVLVVNPSVEAKTVGELIAAAKSTPGKITVGTSGVGSAPYMYWELFRSVTGVDMVEVSYHGGGPAMIDLLGGRIALYFGTFATTMGYIKAGKLRPLAVTSAKRAAVLPDVPALAEFFPNFEASIYVGLAAPRGTPDAIVETLNKTVNQALTDQKLLQRIDDLGDAPLSLSVADFGKLVAAETEKWRKVVQAAHIKAE